MFEEILKRCGRFLTHISLKFSDMDVDDSENVLSIVAKECTNLRHIDLSHYRVTKNFIQLFQPNFHKIEVLRCVTDGRINDNDFNNLFLKTTKLKHLKIVNNCNGNFLHALNKETLTYLELQSNMNGMNFITYIIINFIKITYSMTKKYCRWNFNQHCKIL